MQKQAREIVQKDILQLQNCCLEIAEKKKKKDGRFLLYFSTVFSLYKEVLIFLPFSFPCPASF